MENRLFGFPNPAQRSPKPPLVISNLDKAFVLSARTMGLIVRVSTANSNVIKMPDARTLQTVDRKVTIVNADSAAITIQDNNAGALTTIPAKKSATLMCRDITTSSGTWKTYQ